MKKYFKIITLSLSLTILLANHVFAGAASGRPTSYLVTAHKLEYCSGASTLASCVDSTVVGENTSGTEMDLSDSTSAVSFGNAGLLVVGKTYTHAQITITRLFKVGGSLLTTGGSAATCQTGGTAGTEDAGGATNGSSEAAQAMAARDNTTYGEDLNSVSAIGGTGTAKTIADNHNFLQFRWKLSESFTPQAGKIPSMSIAFDLSEALEFNDGAGDGACDGDDFYPGSPVITNTFN